MLNRTRGSLAAGRNDLLSYRFIHAKLAGNRAQPVACAFYTEGEADKRTPILSIRVAADLPEEERPLFEYLSTESESFAKYAKARANRRDPFFITPAGGADICNIPVPVRAFEYADEE